MQFTDATTAAYTRIVCVSFNKGKTSTVSMHSNQADGPIDFTPYLDSIVKQTHKSSSSKTGQAPGQKNGEWRTHGNR